MTDFFERPPNERGLPDTADSNQEQCPTPQNSPMHTPKSSVSTTPPAKPHRNEIWGILPDKRRVSCGWPACLRRQPPRVTFRNNDIYIIDDEDYKEPRERHPKVQYKLRICYNPAAQNMLHEEDFDDNNYK